MSVLDGFHCIQLRPLDYIIHLDITYGNISLFYQMSVVELLLPRNYKKIRYERHHNKERAFLFSVCVFLTLAGHIRVRENAFMAFFLGFVGETTSTYQIL